MDIQDGWVFFIFIVIGRLYHKPVDLIPIGVLELEFFRHKGRAGFDHVIVMARQASRPAVLTDII